MPDEPSAQPAATSGDDASVIRVLRTQIIRSEVRLLELNDAIAQRDTEGAATRDLLQDAQRQLDLALSETRSLTQQRDDLAAEIPHIRHQQHIAGLELEKAHGLLRAAIREKDEWVGRHHATASQLDAEQQAHAAERGAHAHTRTELDLARRRIAELEQESAARAADVVAHAARIRELDAAIAHLQAVRAELETLRDRLIAQGDTLRAELAQARDAIAQRDAKIRQIQASFSWKVTTPLRWLRRVLLRR